MAQIAESLILGYGTRTHARTHAHTQIQIYQGVKHLQDLVFYRSMIPSLHHVRIFNVPLMTMSRAKTKVYRKPFLFIPFTYTMVNN